MKRTLIRKLKEKPGQRSLTRFFVQGRLGNAVWNITKNVLLVGLKLRHNSSDLPVH
jgi:hypothetical protein